MNKWIITSVFIFISTLSTNLRAEVADSSAIGFTVKQVVELTSTAPDSAYNRFVKSVGKWWESSHTYSGDSQNLSISITQNGGCFCEKLPSGGVVRHLSVIYVDPGKVIRMTGGLGPLQEMAVNGVLTVTFQPVNSGVKVEMTYTVGGYSKVRLSKYASMVDFVLGTQMKRYKEFCEKP